MSRIDDILDVLDNPTQQAGDVAYASSVQDECWRCGVAINEPERKLGACTKCVAYLRGEGDDPKSSEERVIAVQCDSINVSFGGGVFMPCRPIWSDPGSDPLRDMRDFISRWRPIAGLIVVELLGDFIEGFDDDSFTPIENPPTFEGVFDVWTSDLYDELRGIVLGDAGGEPANRVDP